MIDGLPVVAIILARGGSKRLPGKNVRPLGGKPLIAWSVEASLASQVVDRTILSTDDDAIMAAGQEAGCETPFVRPAELSGDDATSEDAILHALDTMDIRNGYLVLLQPTSPLRTSQDIDTCMRKCHEANAPVCVTVTKVDCPVAWLLKADTDGHIARPFAHESGDVFRPNGAVYVADVAWFREHRKFWVEGVSMIHELPVARSVDIDTEDDFQMAQAIISNPYLMAQ